MKKDSLQKVFQYSRDIQHWVTPPATVRSLYSLYMLCVPLRESYRNQMAMFLILVGCLSVNYQKRKGLKGLKINMNYVNNEGITNIEGMFPF